MCYFRNLTLKFISLYTLIYFVSCKSLVDVPPPANQLVSSNVFNNPNTAASVMSGIYVNMAQDRTYTTGKTSLSYLLGLYADELIDWTVGLADQTQFYKNQLNQRNVIVLSKWTEIYKIIYTTNAVVDGVANSSLDKKVAAQLIGEAKFIRAFNFFYLVNLWGAVPMPLSSDYKENRLLGRESVETIIKQIESDLIEAKSLLSDKFLNGTITAEYNERVRPTKWAATALLARVYLFSKKYSEAESQATQLINNNDGLFSLVELPTVFLKDSREILWAVQSPGNGLFNSVEANTYILINGIDNQHTVSLDTELVKSFELSDSRMNWIGEYEQFSKRYYFSQKYRNRLYTSAPSTEYTVVFRLAEQYLIRAEARVNLKKFSEAEEDINAIRKRANLPSISLGSNMEQDIQIVLNEKRHEMFTEWGMRWFDLKRQPNFNAVMNSIALAKGINWNPKFSALPIPQAELDRNGMLQQNDGY